ncbi:MAG TPA: hypothetical protein VFY97_10220 [Rhodanobacteraceae bacterium]|nr:hypothetical protein [Rhodanobacteraceae bacterium]
MKPGTPPASRPARVQMSRQALERSLCALGAGRLRHMRATARGLVDLLGEFVARGVTPLADTVGADTPQAWQQFALDDIRMQRAGELFFYYHSHARDPHPEHGHFHVFRCLASRSADVPPRYAHLVGIGVDARGLPQRLFTTNRWVTNECWRDARDGVAALARIVAARRRLATPCERWLRGMVAVFFPQIALLLRHRDRRVAAHGGARVLEDHRMYVLSECPVSLGEQMAALDSVVR